MAVARAQRQRSTDLLYAAWPWLFSQSLAPAQKIGGVYHGKVFRRYMLLNNEYSRSRCPSSWFACIMLGAPSGILGSRWWAMEKPIFGVKYPAGDVSDGAVLRCRAGERHRIIR